MVNMMRYHIDLFRDHGDRKVLCKGSPKAVFKFIGFVCAIPVMPYSAMRAHNDHAVNKRGNQKRNGKKLEDEQEKKRGQQYNFYPAEKWQPVLFCFENI
jgi:hypothetical protein